MNSSSLGRKFKLKLEILQNLELPGFTVFCNIKSSML
jgi:hypothetical protein